MTGMLEAPRLTEEATDASPVRRGGAGALRAELRLAARQVRRAKGASLLVALLVALPIIPVSAAAVVFASRTPTLAQEVDVELGAANGRLEVVNGPDPSLRQSAVDPWYWEVDSDPATGEPLNAEHPRIPDPTALLPEGTATIGIGEDTVAVRTAAGIGEVHAVVGDSWDSALAGRYELLAGARPTARDEAMVSPGALARFDLTVGDTLELAEPAASFTVVGVLSEGSEPHTAQTVFLPWDAATSAVADVRFWFTPTWQPAEDDLAAFNAQGVVVFGRELMMQREGSRSVDPSLAWTIASASMIGLAFIGYLVVLLAGAAFSVSARRRQRALAVAASVGASKASLFRIVLWQGAVLGLAGGLAGAALGIVTALPVLALLDDGRTASYWSFHVPWGWLAALVAFAAGVGLLAALAPARTATRGDVLHALRGARLPVTVRVQRPLWGSVLLMVGFAMSLISGVVLATLFAADPGGFDDPRRTVALWGIVAGPLLFQIGVLLAGHWILGALARVLSRGGVAPRLAARDAAAHPGRIVPAFAAIAACVFLASFALSAVSVFSASSARGYWWQAPEGRVFVSVSAVSSTPEAVAVERAAVEAITVTDPTATAIVRGEPQNYESIDGRPADERLATVWRAERFGAPSCDDPATVGACLTDFGRLIGPGSGVRVIAADELETALGTPVPDDALTVFREGGALVLAAPSWEISTPVQDGTITLREWDGAVINMGNLAIGDGGLQMMSTPAEGTGGLAPLRVERLPAARVATPHSLPWEIVISPETAAALQMRTAVQTVIGAYDPEPAQEGLDRLTQLASGTGVDGGFSFGVERGPAGPEPWLWLILAATGALVVGAGSVALGLARIERRPDDATLVAIGGAPRMRRAIAFWQALVIVGIGSVVGTIAGVIPVWGLAIAVDGASIADLPALWLGLLAVALPVSIAVVAWLVRPRHPELTRRTAIT